jgi:alpha-1,6-mannosyltransferase
VEQRTGARLLLVGAGPEEARLKAHAYGPRVLFLPFMQDRVPLANLLAAIDLYVAAGPAETFGLSAVEAMATGTPVLTANRGAVAEHVLRSDGGQLFEAGNPASVAVVAEQLLSGTTSGGLRELGDRAHRFAVTEHAWDTVLRQLFTVYRNVAAAHGR